MSGRRCAMAPMVEADRDGRLDARDEASIARHLSACAECRQHRAELVRLGGLAARPTLPPAIPLDHQRRRAALLQAAAVEGGAGASPSGGRNLRRPAMALALAGAAALVAAGPRLGSRPDAVVAVVRKLPAPPRLAEGWMAGTVEPAAIVEPGAGARFTRTRDGLVERVELEEGALDLHVPRSRSGQRFVVATADAEVTVEGDLRIEAHQRRVTAVRVQEGRAEVRYAGYLDASGAAPTKDPPALVEAGQAWAPVSMGGTPSKPLPPAVTKRPGSAAPAAADRSPLPASSVSVAAGPRGSASKVFAEGMRLIERGDYAAGADKLESYRRANPGEARAEDAAYLTILALQRAGRHDEARAAAARYLAQYPNGYRRAEVERLARP